MKNNKKNKNPFAPWVLEGQQAKWFIDYLEGKNRDPEVEKNRKKTLRMAEKIENPEFVCLK